MKKSVIALLLALALCFGLCACGGSDSGMDKDTEYVIKSFFAQENYGERKATLDENYQNYPELTTEELEAIIEGDWLLMTVEDMTCEDWWTYEFDDGVRETKMHYFVNGAEQKTTDLEGQGLGDKYIIEDGTVYFEFLIDCNPETFEGYNGYKFYKMHDNFYFVKKVHGEIYEHAANDYIYAQLDVEGKLVYENESWQKYEMYNKFKDR